MFRLNGCALMIAGAVAMSANVARATTGEVARVLNAAGGPLSSAGFLAVAAACQPQPVGTTASAAFINRGGFLMTFLMFPGLDNDGDGIADEDDPDDDNDGLSDPVELTGGAFDPATITDSMNADSDGDGSPDGGEAVAMTDPSDGGSRLAITDIQRAANAVTVTWQSRGGLTYELERGTNLQALLTNPDPVGSVTGVGGVPPWYVTESMVTNNAVSMDGFFRVRVVE